MGRQSANEGFLRAWFAYSGQSEFWCLARYREEAEIFARIGQDVHSGHAKKPLYRWISQDAMHRIAPVGLAYLPGPQVAEMAWKRRRHSSGQATDYSLVGMTHTTCELQIQDGLADMLTAPVYEWDAQICPSASVQAMVSRLLDDEAYWLQEHLGAVHVRRPQLPILPLGIHLDSYTLAPVERRVLRQTWRTRWSLADDDVCVLYMGRLDLRTKADLFPMFDALELTAQRLARDGGPRLTLVLSGWFATEWDERVIREGVTLACPGVRVIVEDGRQPEVRRAVWQAADVFCSLVDNVQETFGLTPIEAMAAGLPVVVTDYDGYKESVRDGVDGFRIRTWQPPAGQGVAPMDRHADLMLGYREYVSYVSAQIGVDVEQAVQAFERLARSPQLRAQMGASGAERAKSYDWSALVPQYQALFADLAVLRRQTAAPAHWRSAPSPWGARQPRRSDPYHAFAHYPTATLSPATSLLPGPLSEAAAPDRRKQLSHQLSRPLYQGRDLREDWMLAVLEQVCRAPQEGVTVSTCIAGAGTQAPLNALGQLAWMIKAGLLRPVA